MKISARKLFYAMPPAWRFAVRRLYYLPLDTWQALAGQRDSLTPPKGLIYTGGGDFRQTGERALRFFQLHCGLHPDSHVLDVGSGIGRMAIPLAGFLREQGAYEGFDVVEKGVDWCREHISSRYPNFRFQYIPLNNDLYRTDGINAAAFRFPYDDNRFDLVIVNSVFTHMLPDEVDNYLGEIKRVLKPGGYCYATFFLFDENTRWLEGFDFPFNHGHYRLMDEAVKSANVAFEENYFIENLTARHGLAIQLIQHGSWRGTNSHEKGEFQDVVVIRG